MLNGTKVVMLLPQEGELFLWSYSSLFQSSSLLSLFFGQSPRIGVGVNVCARLAVVNASLTNERPDAIDSLFSE